jgi:hypothetical protein
MVSFFLLKSSLRGCASCKNKGIEPDPLMFCLPHLLKTTLESISPRITGILGIVVIAPFSPIGWTYTNNPQPREAQTNK